ncbi:MAG: sialidase family protein [Ktedonobacteraceae bacterium]
MRKSRMGRYRGLGVTGLVLAPAVLLIVLIMVHVIPSPVSGEAVIFGTPTNLYRQPLQLSSDPYTNPDSQHFTELEPGTYSYGSTIVTAFQAGRYADGGSSNNAWATSTDGGLTWSKPYKVVDGGSTYYDKDWITCDTSYPSPFYGNWYVEWDNDDKDGLILMSTSIDGGLTWSKPRTTADQAHGLGGQPLVQPGGTVIVPIAGYGTMSLLSFVSTDGGQSWSKTTLIARINGNVLPSAQIDGAGKVYLVWIDCQFEKNCNATGGGEDAGMQNAVHGGEQSTMLATGSQEDDLVMSTTADGLHWTPPRLIPADPLGSGIDHLIPGIGVDRSTSSANAHLALAFYYHLVNCDSDCPYSVGFESSTDSGARWTQKITLAGPMDLSWLPGGRNKVGDYITTSFCNGLAFPVFSIAYAPSNGHLNEAMYTINGGLTV